MSDALRLHDLAPSPNNIKVRLGLGLKGLAHERIPVNPQDRTDLVALSGQPLSPVLEHGERVVFDSGAILRYLDANFRASGARLFAEDRDTMRAIERWELHARTRLQPAIGAIFGHFFDRAADPEAPAKGSALLNEATADLEARLAEGDWLVGDAPTAADCCCAPFAWYGMVPESAAPAGSIQAFFREHLHLGDGRERTRAWAERAMAFDR